MLNIVLAVAAILLIPPYLVRYTIVMRQFDTFRDGDWNCLKCGANNFSRRTFCFKQDCKAPKPTTREERGSFRGDRRDSGGPHPGDQRGPGDYRGPGDQRGSFRGDRRDSEGPHLGDQRHFGQAQPPMPSPQSTVSLISV